MIDTSFVFDGIRAKDMGLELQAPLILTEAVPRVETYSIPGRNGDLHFYDGSYDNRRVYGSCFVLGRGASDTITRINRWLLGSRGYKRLILDECPDHFLLARSEYGLQQQLRLGILGKGNISFDCMPQRFLMYGEKSVEVSHLGGIVNPTGFASLPLITVTGSGNVTVSSGDWEISITDLNGSLTFDSESSFAYNGNTNLNSFISVSGEVVLLPGENVINISGNVESLRITPRWWEI